jgi:glycosyltransferase involved in cell wall biosynthesis
VIAPSETPLQVLLSVESLIGTQTGIGQYTRHLLQGLAQRPDVSVFAYGRGELRERPPFVPEPVDPQTRSAARRLRTELLGAALGALKLHEPIDARIFSRRTRHLAATALYHEPNYVARPYDGPCVATLHDLTWLHFPELVHPHIRRWLDRGMPRTLRQAQRFIAVSHFVAQELTTHLGIPRERISVTHLGVDARFHPRSNDEIAGVVTTRGLTPGHYVLSVATMEPRKNLLGLLRAFARLPVTLQREYPIVLAGAAGWHSAPLEALVERLTRRGCLRQLGYVDDRLLPVLYSGARAFALPSFYEGFGLPPLEAMASGVPVLTSDRTALPEVCADAAVLVNPDDLDAIADGLERVMIERSLRRHLTTEGLARAGCFRWKRTVTGTLDVYRKVLT